MKRLALSLAALVAVIAVVLALLRDRPGPGAVSKDDEPLAPAAESPAIERGQVGESSAAGRVERGEGAVLGRVREVDGQPVVGDDRLRGVVLDDAGAPAVGAPVALSREIAGGMSFLDLDRLRGSETLASAVTDARGEFEFDVDPERAYVLDVDATGFAPQRLDDCRGGEFVEIRLERGATVFGRVTRAADGTPIAGAQVEIHRRQREGGYTRRRGRGESRTDALGRYELPRVDPGSYWLEVTAETLASPSWIEIELAPGDKLERDVALVAGHVVRGRITDARTGAPIEGAQIGQGWTFERVVSSDRNGEYVYAGFSPGYEELMARASGYGACERSVVSVETGEMLARVDFALEPGRRCVGRIVDSARAPIEGAYVAAVAQQFGDSEPMQRGDWRSTSSRSDGGFTIEDVRADLAHVLFARKPGYGSVVYEFPPDEARSPTTDMGEIVLAPAGSVRGDVVDADGKPLAGQEVTLAGSNSDRAKFREVASDDRWLVDSYVATRATRTDPRGRFAFADLAGGDYVISARLESQRDGAEVRVTIESGARVDGIRLELDSGQRIAGRVVASDGGALPTVYVSVDPVERGRAADVQADAEGRFEAQGLSSGPYFLTVYPYATEEQQSSGRRFVPTRSIAVEAGTLDAVIPLRVAGRVQGVVVDAAGVAVHGAMVVLRDTADITVDQGYSRADGTFELFGPADDLVTVEARPALVEGGGEGAHRILVDPALVVTLRDVEVGGAAVTLQLPWRR